jgi:hypothetical protein
MTSAGGFLPLHVLDYNEVIDKQPLTSVVNMLLDIYNEGAAVAALDGTFPHHRIITKLCLTDVKRLVEAHPAALSINADHLGNPLCQAATRVDAEGLAVVQYLYEKRPEIIMEGAPGSEWFPLHYAARDGSLEIMKFLLSKYPKPRPSAPISERSFIVLCMKMIRNTHFGTKKCCEFYFTATQKRPVN